MTHEPGIPVLDGAGRGLCRERVERQPPEKSGAHCAGAAGEKSSSIDRSSSGHDGLLVEMHFGDRNTALPDGQATRPTTGSAPPLVAPAVSATTEWADYTQAVMTCPTRADGTRWGGRVSEDDWLNSYDTSLAIASPTAPVVDRPPRSGVMTSPASSTRSTPNRTPSAAASSPR